MQKTSLAIAIFYTVFAILSTLINIGCQMISMLVYKGVYAVEISMLVGTAAGLPIRYLLEKRYIFSFESKNLKHDSELFLIYSLMGVITTTIFWVTEYAFHLLFSDTSMRYIGAAIGLTIGFYVKYRLDKKYVFIGQNKRTKL